MHLGLEDTLPALVRSRFTAAKAAQALIFSSTELSILHSRDQPFQLRYCPALAKKPKSNDDTAEQQSQGKKPDPFEDPSADLLIANLPRANPTHILVLNKYPVIPQHFILATKLNKEQTHMLEADDLAATHACLREWEKDSPSRNGSPSLFAFFNSGAHSGASQAHRHLQFLPVAEMKRDQGGDEKWDPLVSQMLDDRNAPVDESSLGMRSLRDMPFTHFALPLPATPSAEQLQAIYQRLYDAAAAAVRAYIALRKGDLELHRSEGGSSPISYNLAMTTSGMAIFPRRREAADLVDENGKEVGSVAINGTILAGTLMVKAEEEWSLFRRDSTQLDKVLKMIGIPPSHTQTVDSEKL